MQRPRQEERANALTHGFGILLSLVGCVLITKKMTSVGTPISVKIAVGLYLFGLVGVYVSSTLSHVFDEGPKQKLFRRLDQSFIYLLIVGTFTPFSVAHLDGAWWWFLLIAMWTMALIGFFSKLLYAHRLQTVSIILYLFVGWMPFWGGMLFAPEMPRECMLWIIYGGIAYTSGTIFLYKDTKATYNHAIWHLFVMAGSAIHFYAIYHQIVS